jgi:hypothetical protein
LVKDQTLDEFGVINGASELLDELDVSQIDVGGDERVNDLENGIDSDRREQARVLRDDFGVERGRGALQQRLPIG